MTLCFAYSLLKPPTKEINAADYFAQPDMINLLALSIIVAVSRENMM